MTDIATRDLLDGLADIRNALHSGRFGQREVWEKHLEEASAALSRLSAPPPEEIAGLIAELQRHANASWAIRYEHDGWIEKAAAALRSLALENERQREESVVRLRHLESAAQRVGRANDRIRELEAERDKALTQLSVLISDDHRNLVSATKAERDAIRAKTFEECASTKITVRGLGILSDDYLKGFHDGALAKTDAIRTLAQSPKDEEK